METIAVSSSGVMESLATEPTTPSPDAQVLRGLASLLPEVQALNAVKPALLGAPFLSIALRIILNIFLGSQKFNLNTNLCALLPIWGSISSSFAELGLTRTMPLGASNKILAEKCSSQLFLRIFCTLSTALTTAPIHMNREYFSHQI